MNDSLFEVDPEVASAIALETRRQNENLELIASENFVSEAVLEATGSVFTNKYAEGYPGKRYYAGCEFVDQVETLVQTRAKKLFGAEHVNAQPHSGTQANVAVYMTVCKPGDTILGMNLAHGGHLTHGHPLNFSGKMYRVQPYGVDAETEQIDYDELERLAQEHKPRLIVCGASAYPRIIDFERIGENRPVGRRAFDGGHRAYRRPGGHGTPSQSYPAHGFRDHHHAQDAEGTARRPGHVQGRIRQRRRQGGFSGNPRRSAGPRHRRQSRLSERSSQARLRRVPATNSRQRQRAGTIRSWRKGFRLVSGGTDNHLMLVDVFSRGITGKDAEQSLEKANITVNKNAIPFDKNPPMVASGIRVGTPAVTSRGMREKEMETIGRLIARVLRAISDQEVRRQVRQMVLDLCDKFPLYPKRMAVIAK